MARRRDPAEIETDKIIAEIERRLKVEYAQAQREIAEKIEDYYRRYSIKLETWNRWVSEGKKTQAEYNNWKIGQLAIGKRWESLRDQLAHDLYNTNQIAHSIARGYMPDVYALNHDYGTFECEVGSGMDTSYTLYSREAAENIFRDDPQMLPGPGKKVSREIAEGKAIRWNNRHIQSVAIQAILQGNNISDIATRLANAVGDSDRKAAIRNARTMATAYQNRGRIDAYKRAESMGIENRKMWLATIDMRTRHEHRMVDKQTVNVDAPFVVDGYKMMYPCDFSAPGYLVYNCRCTVRSVVKGLKRMSGTSGDLDLSQIEGMSYEEWKKSKTEKTKNILRPDQRADKARASYIREYAENPNLVVPSGRRTDLSIDSLNDDVSRVPGFFDPEVRVLSPPKSLEDSLKPTVMDKYARQIRKAPDEVQTMHELFDGDVKFVRVKDYGSCYNADEGIIYFKDKKEYENLDRFNIINHELGHLYDDRIDGGLKDLTFREIEDIRNAIGLDNTFRDMPSRSDKFLHAMRNDIERLSDIFYSDAWKDTVWDLVKDHASWGVQDFIDGAFGDSNRTGVFWGHGNEYYNRTYDFLSDYSRERAIARLDDSEVPVWDRDSLKATLRDYLTASELWANINSALTDGGDELDYMLRYAPDSVQAFLEIGGMLRR